MDFSTYTLTVTLILLAPGPLTAALLIRAITCDIGSALNLAAGILLARASLLALAMTGAFTWLALYPGSIEAFKWVGAACLALMAINLWQIAPQSVSPSGRQGIVDLTLGIALTLSSPYNVVLYLTLLPSLGERIATVPHLVVAATLIPTLVVVTSLILIGRYGRRWRSGANQFSGVRRLLALSLGGIAFWIAVS